MRESTLDALLHQLNTDVLGVWVPVISTATLIIGLIAGIAIRGCMDSVPAAAATPTPSLIQVVPTSNPRNGGGQVGSSKQKRHSEAKAEADAENER